MIESSIRNLACAICMQAAKDYFATENPDERKVILKDLRSKYMEFITNGTSVAVADQLEMNPNEIRDRMRRYHEISEA